MFDETPNETFDQREKRILKYWQENGTFQRSLEERMDQPHFIFYDGPPFATGLPHYGHLLAGTMKDVVPRYKTMKGYCVPRRFGWDCHGLPIEQEIEKAHDLSGAKSIEAFGIAHFNEACRKIVLRYTEEWKQVVQRMGRWIDFDEPYKTMDRSFMESVWWVFKQLYDKGLIYEGYKVMPFSAKLGTPLSNFEAGENYKEVDDPSLTVAFSIKGSPNTALLIWTTTPWTLISNMAVMAGPHIHYVKVHDKAQDKNYILAETALARYYKSDEEYEIIERFSGEKLKGVQYLPLFPYFENQAEVGAFRVILEESVSLEEGTGLVHAAPAFGEVDFYASRREGTPLVCPVDENGQFDASIPEYQGLFVKDADKDIIKRLKEKGSVVRHTTVHHRYPFCWRSDTPLIYKAVRTWFVAVEKIKEKMIAANQQIHWMPQHLKEGRFGKWLQGARDWAISRNRYWGTPIPIWRAEDGEMIVLGSVADLEKETTSRITDLHRHFIDPLKIERNGKIFTRIPEVFDCWFESGSMPYAQLHYPFENRTFFEENFPADFIAEGVDQTRGWFYTLTILAAALLDKPAFKNVVVNGIVLSADGSKMSKRLKNYPDPLEVVHKYGADAIRLYMLHSSAVKGEDLCFSENGVELVLRQVLIPYWNAYSFFITYARLYKWIPKNAEEPTVEAAIDRWMLSMLNKLVHEVEQGMDQYDLSRAVEPFISFIDQLTNWYIRRSRRRFWTEVASPDRDQAFSTLYFTLLTLSKIAAPFVPFISEAIYLHLRTTEMPTSVHLCNYPEYHPRKRDLHLEESMALVQTAVSLGHSLRKENKLKVRQPLPVAHIVSGDTHTIQFLQEQQHLIAEELNVKEVRFGADEAPFVSLNTKPNFRILGKKVGGHMRAVQMALQALTAEQQNALLEGRSITLQVEGVAISLEPDDVHVERKVHEGIIAANAGRLTLALDMTLTEELLQEGLMRELINKINTMRRDAGLAVSDRITLSLQTTEKVQTAYEQYRDYICSEVLAKSVHFEKCNGIDWELNGEPTRISLSKV
jgi:isoleucyl-tRNA synthetase